MQPGKPVEILAPSLYAGQQGCLLQQEDCSQQEDSDRWLVAVTTEQESFILSLAPQEFRPL